MPPTDGTTQAKKNVKISDLFEESYGALTANKARSGLTILGIVIGIGSVIALVSIGAGAQSSIESNIQAIGSNLILVSPGAQRSGGGLSAGQGSAQTLTQADADAIKKDITLAKAVAPELSRRYQVTAKGNNTNTQIVGTTDTYAEVRKVTVDSGSFITASQIKSFSKVAVLGPTTRDDLFGSSTDALGQTVRINKINFKVIGVTQAKGGSGFTNQDDVIYIPISTAQQFLAGASYVTSISVEANSASDMNTMQTQITSLLLARHNIANAQLADFRVLNQTDIVAAASSVTDIFTMLLASIAGISLIVGGIGIMNMMLTTVTERTREIGLRKAIGATRSSINSQFLTEAVMLTFLGGFIGIIFGWALSLIATRFTGIQGKITLSSILLAFGVSAAIGLIFGYYPARRAAKLNPIEALRFE